MLSLARRNKSKWPRCTKLFYHRSMARQFDPSKRITDEDIIAQYDHLLPKPKSTSFRLPFLIKPIELSEIIEAGEECLKPSRTLHSFDALRDLVTKFTKQENPRIEDINLFPRIQELASPPVKELLKKMLWTVWSDYEKKDHSVHSFHEGQFLFLDLKKEPFIHFHITLSNAEPGDIHELRIAALFESNQDGEITIGEHSLSPIVGPLTPEHLDLLQGFGKDHFELTDEESRELWIVLLHLVDQSSWLIGCLTKMGWAKQLQQFQKGGIMLA